MLTLSDGGGVVICTLVKTRTPTRSVDTCSHLQMHECFFRFVGGGVSASSAIEAGLL